MKDRKRGWRELPKGAVSYKSSRDYHTGDWGVYLPNIDKERCTKCTLCHFFCPEGAIVMGDDDFPLVYCEYCKGCGICAEECPVNCIDLEMKK